jgi:hypothetical protein
MERAYLTMILDSITLEDLVQRSDDETALEILAALAGLKGKS